MEDEQLPVQTGPIVSPGPFNTPAPLNSGTETNAGGAAGGGSTNRPYAGNGGRAPSTPNYKADEHLIILNAFKKTDGAFNGGVKHPAVE